MQSTDSPLAHEGDSQWRVAFLPAASKQFDKLGHEACRKINKYIETRLTTKEDPRRFGKELVGNLKGFWRYRIADYRLICKIEDHEIMIFVVRVDHRKDVYE